MQLRASYILPLLVAAASATSWRSDGFTCRGVEYKAGSITVANGWSISDRNPEAKTPLCDLLRSSKNQGTAKDTVALSPPLAANNLGYYVQVPCWTTAAGDNICCTKLAYWWDQQTGKIVACSDHSHP